MKVIISEDNKLEFDNGLKVYGEHESDCCENNYLDFEQLPVGTELPNYSATQFLDSVTLKEDGFIVRDINGIPLWVQARSEQNGYYSSGVDLVINDEKTLIRPKKPGKDTYGELFNGVEN